MCLYANPAAIPLYTSFSIVFQIVLAIFLHIVVHTYTRLLLRAFDRYRLGRQTTKIYNEIKNGNIILEGNKVMIYEIPGFCDYITRILVSFQH